MLRLLVVIVCVCVIGLPVVAQDVKTVARVAVLELGPGESDPASEGEYDLLGLHVDAEMLRDLIPVLECAEVTHVLFRVNSRGGAEYSAQQIAELIHSEFNPRFETSAWLIESTAAPSIAVFPCEQWIAHPSGIYEAMKYQHRGLVQYRPSLIENWPMSPGDWVKWLAERAPASRNNTTMIRGLLTWDDLSADIDDEGNVTWRDDTDGQVLVSSEPDRYPVFDAEMMMTLGLAVGWARTLDEALALAVPGERVLVAMDANLELHAERVAVNEEMENLNELFVRYVAAVQLMSGATGEPTDHARGVYHDVAAETLVEIEAGVEKRASLALFVLGMTEAMFEQWAGEQKDLLRKLKRGK